VKNLQLVDPLGFAGNGEVIVFAGKVGFAAAFLAIWD